MEIKQANLTFASALPKKDTDLYSFLSEKIILCSENQEEVVIDWLHQDYIQKNLCGFPYHYTVFRNGDIYHCRSRIYENGFLLSYNNWYKNAICILVEGVSDAAFTQSQKDSLVQLCTMIVMDGAAMVPGIITQEEIRLGRDERMRSLRSDITAEIAKYDIYRTVGDYDDSKTFYKIISSENACTMEDIWRYTAAPVDILWDMNPHLTEYKNDVIPYGKTIYVPRNRVNQYLLDIENECLIGDLYFRAMDEMQAFREVISRKEG